MKRHALPLAALALLGLQACRRSTPPPPAPPQEDAALAPWSWHALGGILVVEGETDRPLELHLKGRFMDERRRVEYGPVRWELYRPPPGEVAELRGDGRLLARWDFDAPAPEAAPLPAPAPPAPAPKAPPPPAVQKPQPVLPKPERRPAPAPSKPGPASAPTAPPSRSVPPTPKPPPVPVNPKPQPTPAAPKPRPETPPVPRPAAAVRPTPPFPQPTEPRSGAPLNLLRGPRGGRRVALTFDGGSSSEVATEVLDALQARNLRTTVFLTGAFIRRFPELVRRMAREGHEVGNHTFSHPHLAPAGRRDPAWTRARFQAELRDTEQAFAALTGRSMAPLWRAPYGEHTAELRAWAEELGYRHVGWSEGADTLDWATARDRRLYRTGDAILARLRARMARQDGDGLIVLMHLGSARPAEDRPAQGLGAFLDASLHAGWRFVPVSEYLPSASARAAMADGAPSRQGAGRR